MPDDFDPEYKRALFRKLPPRVAQAIFAKPKDSPQSGTWLQAVWRFVKILILCMGLLLLLGTLWTCYVIRSIPGAKPHFANLVHRWLVESTGAISSNPLGFALLVVEPLATLLVAGFLLGALRGWKEMKQELAKSIFITFLITLAVQVILFGPVFIWHGIDTVYQDHQTLVNANAETTRKSTGSATASEKRIAELESQLEKRKQSLPHTDPAFWNITQSFGIFYALQKDLNGEPCSLYFTTANADDVFDTLYATSTNSGCSVSGVMNLGNPDLDKDITENVVPGVVIIHRSQSDAVAARFTMRLAPLVRTRESYAMPPSGHYVAPFPAPKEPNTTVHIIWLQFGSNMKWNSQPLGK